jgi:tRNA uridine 5-carbamoylmethylation protein Kti12
MEARGVVSMELTVGSKSLATAFFVVEVQCNYSVILGRNWIHTNCYIPSTLHQFLIQWIDDELKVVHADASAYILLADATVD